MERLLENARALAAEYGMFPAGTRVLCAVSGGADSMCLLHWLSGQKELSLVAAHFNHQLRENESDRDEAFVRDFCARHNIPLTVGRGDVRNFAQREKLSIEEAARTLRYTFLFRAAEEEGCSRIATAHNAGDNAETVLLHLLRGSGLNGLTGIAPRLHNIVRPLLTSSRKEIEDYLAVYHIPHIEDSTNADDAYTRNRVRHQLIPLLEEMNPGFVRRLSDAIPRLRADNDCLNAMARQLFRQAKRRGEDLVIPVAPLCHSPLPVASRAVRLLLAEAAEGNWDCSAAHIEAVLALCKSNDPSARYSLPRQLTVLREYGQLVFTHAPDPGPLEEFIPVQGENPIPGTAWAMVLGAPPWPGLAVRSRKVGDAITLPGRPRKSVKELFINEKVPRRLRERIPLAADGDGVLALADFGANTSHPRSNLVRFILREKEEIDHGK